MARDLSIQNFIDFKVKPTMRIKDGYGYRVVLKYADKTEKVQQKSGFSSKKEADKAREKTIADLYNGTYIAYPKLKLKEFMDIWLEDDLGKRSNKQSTYSTFQGVIKNHINSVLGNKNMEDISPGDIQGLYNKKTKYSESVAKLVRTVMQISFKYAVDKKFISNNPTLGINLPSKTKTAYHVRTIDPQKTLSMEQIQLLIEKSRSTPIYIQLLLNVLLGLRRSEIIGVKFSDVDYLNRTITIERQLGVIKGTKKDDFAAKTYTKQEIDLKTASSHRVLPIPDLLYEAIIEERKKYEKNRSRRSTSFQDLDYIYCSSYGRPRSKDYHWEYYKALLIECNLPDIRWHDLRKSYATLLLKNNFSLKAVSKLMGHSKESITMDVYGDNKGIIEDCTPEIEDFILDVIPNEAYINKEELLQIVVDAGEYMPVQRKRTNVRFTMDKSDILW